MESMNYNYDFLDAYISKALSSSKPEQQIGDETFFVDSDEEIATETSNYSESYNPDDDEQVQEMRSATMDYLLGDDEEERGNYPMAKYPTAEEAMYPTNFLPNLFPSLVPTITTKKGSIAETHNNPGNLKYASWMKKYGAVPGKAGTDGGQFAMFPNVQAALEARSELLQKPLYASKTVNEAMKLYSNKGYDGDIYPEIKNKKMSELNQKELAELTKRQVIREDRAYAKKLRFQTGGVPMAMTSEEKYNGLNDESFDEMFFPLNGLNPIRGLDSGEPVYVEDETGNSDVLYGSDDVAEMDGEVYEQRMAAGGIPDRYKNKGFTKVGAKKQSTRPGKKWMVLAKKGSKYKIVHGGAEGMSDFTKHKNENRRDRFWDRMGGKSSAKATDPFSPLYWHKKFKTW